MKTLMMKPAKSLAAALALIITLTVNDEVNAQQIPADIDLPDVPDSVEDAVENADIVNCSNSCPRPSPSPTGFDLPIPQRTTHSDFINNLAVTGRAADAIQNRQIYFENTLRELESGLILSTERESVIRNLIDQAYYLAWDRFYNSDTTAAIEIEREIERLIEPYDLPSPREQWALPLVQWHWLRYGLYQNRDAEVRRLDQLTREFETFPDDFAELSRFRIIFLQANPEFSRRSSDSPCSIASLLSEISDNYLIFHEIECRLNGADALARVGFPSAAMSELSRIISLIESRRNSDYFHEISILLPVIYQRRATINHELGNHEQEIEETLSAANEFIDSFDGKSRSLRQENEIINAYRAFSNITLSESTRFSDLRSRSEKLITLFTEIFAAIEMTRATYPRSSNLAFIAADAQFHIARASNDLGHLNEAGLAAESAMAIARPHIILERDSVFTEEAASQCGILAENVRVAIGRGDADAIANTYREIETQCGAWLRRFPWDFYARNHLTASATRAGEALVNAGRFSEAIPLLTFASNWGVRDASENLARMYLDGLGTIADPEQAQQLTELAAMQSMKRFTVPTDFAGSKFPFHVYIQQFGDNPRCPVQNEPLSAELVCYGFNGIDDQVKWVQEARGGVVPADVVTSFQRLDAIAVENQVSFPDLAVYALGAAQRENGAPAVAAANSTDTLVVQSAQIIAGPEDASATSNQFRPSVRVSSSSADHCYGWTLRVTAEDKSHNLREELILPDVPAVAPSVGSDSTVFEGGKRIETRLVLSTASGVLAHSWCFAEGDPLGTYHFLIRHNDEELANLTFEVVE